MKDLLDKKIDLTPKPKTGGAARRKTDKKRIRRSEPLYKPHQVVYHPTEENA